ncbi:MAG: hypothetical protein IPN85_17385 [Flavobacteriales bacterium]|nr:hypothetical protein [Flavobacteriales bacterium]
MSNDRPSKLRARNSGVGTIIGITLVLFMLGVLGWLALNGGPSSSTSARRW